MIEDSLKLKPKMCFLITNVKARVFFFCLFLPLFLFMVLLQTGDKKLAHSAQMYHYQHQKQQMLSMEKYTPLCY